VTNKDIANLVRYGDEIGREIGPYLARVVLGAKEILALDPTNMPALDVVRNFAEFLRTGEITNSFAEFMLPLPKTDEEIAERDFYIAQAAKNV
jgi:hypothetical protein